ncbi:MAG: NADAR family protein [Beijerinckiaceae bacterium]|nr:NADAR family protein [Beijerinckiaceae bacterium]
MRDRKVELSNLASDGDSDAEFAQREKSCIDDAIPQIPIDNRILYYGRDRRDFRFLSHFHPSPILIDGTNWPTVEHYYQSQKSPDQAYVAAILAAGRPGRAKRLAAAPDAPRRISKDSWFKTHAIAPRADWHDVKLDIMRRADRAKYAQNADLAVLLLATGDAELIEDAPSEPFWGIGADGDGLNWAGRILMEIRAELRRNSALPQPYNSRDQEETDQC